MSYLEHFNDQARADTHMIAHVREGCKCKGDGVHGAPSDAQKEPAANTSPFISMSIRAIKKQRIEAAASSGEPIHIDNEHMDHPKSSCKSFFLSETYLLSGSNYFRTRLETAVGDLETEMSTVGKLRTITTLHDYIEEGEMEAVELVLKSFYAMGEPLPSSIIPSDIDAKVTLLLKALMVAERYQADRCKEKIGKALSSIPAAQLSYKLAKKTYQLPNALLDIPSLCGLKFVALKVLAQRFGDLLHVITTDSLCAEFLELPFNAVQSLIKRDDLKVHSENDMVYLLDKWIDANEPSPDQIDSLIKEIRVVNLGPAYFHSILPNMQWFKESHFSYHLLSLITIVDTREDIDQIKKLVPELPLSWLSAPRKAPGYIPPASTAFNLNLNEDQLMELNEEIAAYSEPVYHNGHLVKVFVHVDKVEGTDSCSLWVGLKTGGQSIESVYSIRTNHSISVDKVGDAPEKKITDTWILRSDIRLGWPDFLDRQCPTIQEVVAPYLVDGKLTIKFEISKVDEAPVRIPSVVPAPTPTPAPQVFFQGGRGQGR